MPGEHLNYWAPMAPYPTYPYCVPACPGCGRPYGNVPLQPWGVPFVYAVPTTAQENTNGVR